MIAKRNEYLEEAVAELEKINLDPDQEEEYFFRQMALMDERSLRKWSYEDGEKSGAQKATEQITALTKLLLSRGESDLLLSASEDETLRNKLLQQYELI